MAMKTWRTKNAETGVTSSEAWQKCVPEGWEYDAHCMVVWKTRISGFIHLSYKFTPIILGIRWSGDLTGSENIYSIKKESTYISWGRGSWNRCCCCSVTKLCLTLCDPMDCSIPGFPVPYYLLEFAQTHFHWVGDAIQPSHPLPSPSPPALNLSQHQGLF